MSRSHDVPLDAISDADPIADTRLPTADDPRARALFEEITTTSVPHRRPNRSWMPQPMWAAAAAAAVGIGVIGTVALFGDRSPQDADSLPKPSLLTAPIVTAPPTPVASTVSSTSQPISTPAVAPSGGGLCAERYSLDALAARPVAFDGTVVSLEGNQATFVVNQWFRGGEGTELALTANSVTGGPVSSQDGPNLIAGQRYLVAGFGEFVQACGFTQAYDPAVAAEWAGVFAG